jgi:hypothetical protein
MNNCCIHVTNVTLTTDNKLVFSLSNNQSITTAPITISNTTDVYSVSGALVDSNNKLRITRNDATYYDIDTSAYKSPYTIGTGLSLSSNTLSTIPLSNADTSGQSLVNNGTNNVLKAIKVKPELTIANNTINLELGLSDYGYYDIQNNGTTTISDLKAVINVRGSITSLTVVLPPSVDNKFINDFIIYTDSNLLLEATNSNFIALIQSPYVFTNTVTSHTLNAGQCYIIRKFNNTTYIVTKQ